MKKDNKTEILASEDRNERKARVMTVEDKEAENSFYYDLGARMASGRVGSRKQQKDMAYELFTTDNSISAMERGKVKPRAYSLKLFCEATGVEPNYLLGYKGKDDSETELHIMAKVRGMSEKNKKKLLAVLNILFSGE